MKQAKSTPNLRKSLDERFRKKWQRAARDKRPEQGWVREIREALAMSARQLAQLSGMKPSSVVKFERSERKDSIQLKTLRKLGKSLGCELVYALVPDRSLDRILRDRAFGILLPEILVPAARIKMDIPAFVVTELIDTIIAKRKMLDRPHALWDEPKEMKGFSLKEVVAKWEGSNKPTPAPPEPPSPPPSTTQPTTQKTWKPWGADKPTYKHDPDSPVGRWLAEQRKSEE